MHGVSEEHWQLQLFERRQQPVNRRIDFAFQQLSPAVPTTQSYLFSDQVKGFRKIELLIHNQSR
ncbi:hypothetical protein STEG23_008951, partial [Scotinomys teguina]